MSCRFFRGGFCIKQAVIASVMCWHKILREVSKRFRLLPKIHFEICSTKYFHFGVTYNTLSRDFKLDSFLFHLKSSFRFLVELNSLLSKFFCYITWFVISPGQTRLKTTCKRVIYVNFNNVNKVNFKIYVLKIWLTNSYNTYIAQYLAK